MDSENGKLLVQSQRWNKRVREGAAAVLLLSSVVVLAMRYHLLQQKVRSPFNGAGDAHGMGDRSELWLLVFVGAFVYALMSLMNLMPPEAVNSPRPLSREQRERTMEACKAFLGWFKVLVMGGLLLWVALATRAV